MSQYIRSDLKDKVPYHAKKEPYRVKANANESPYPVPEEVLKELEDFSKQTENFTHYPDTDTIALRQAIAKQNDVNLNQVMCSVGSDRLIDLIMRTYLMPNELVYIPEPSFEMYGISCQANHGQPVYYLLDDCFDYQVDTLLKKMEKEPPKLLFLCNPNNPTGNLIERSQIELILQRADCPVVVDEAYYEFSGQTATGLIDHYDNLIVLRTFSKIYGLAGLRVGYAMGASSLIDDLSICKLPYHLSSYSQAAALAVLRHRPLYQPLIDEINRERQRMISLLSNSPFIEQVLPSCTNYFLIQLKPNYKTHILKQIEQAGILLRSYQSTERLADYLRITVNRPLENDYLMAVFQTQLPERSKK